MKKDIKEIWRALAQNKQITAKHMVEYAILRAIRSDRSDKLSSVRYFIRKSFTPITNTSKLANGRKPFDILARWDVSYRNNNYILGQKAEDILTDEELKEFVDLYKCVVPELVVKHYSYFFTRQDISEEQQLVQTAHTALELGNVLTKSEVNNLHFTCIGVPDLEALGDVERVLQKIRAKYVIFKEPDINNEMTCIAVYPIAEHECGVLKSYKLLTFDW